MRLLLLFLWFGQGQQYEPQRGRHLADFSNGGGCIVVVTAFVLSKRRLLPQNGPHRCSSAPDRRRCECTPSSPPPKGPFERVKQWQGREEPHARITQ